MSRERGATIPEREISIERILENVSESSLGYMELIEDVVFRKIPEESRLKLIDYAIGIGRRTSEQIMEEFATKNPFLIAEMMGVTVVHIPKKNIAGNLIIYSEYASKNSTIFVYEGSISQRIGLIIRYQLQHLFPEEDIIAAHVAHELFHHIEKTRIGLVSGMFMITTFSLGPIHIKSNVRALSEIAAQTFAQTLMGMKYSLRLLDYITVEKQSHSFRCERD